MRLLYLSATPLLRQRMASSGAMAAIYGNKTGEEKQAQLEQNLQKWWSGYAERKNDEDGEAVADSLLYDKNTLPRTAPAPKFADGSNAEQVRLREQQQQQSQQQPQGGRPITGDG